MPLLDACVAPRAQAWLQGPSRRPPAAGSRGGVLNPPTGSRPPISTDVELQRPCCAGAALEARQRVVAQRRSVAAAAGGGKDKGAETGGVVGGSAFSRLIKGKEDKMDVVDARQQVDIERLINACHELQDRVEGMEAQLQQFEDRGRDRAVALRAILRDEKMMETLLGQHEDGQLPMPVEEDQEPWDSYRNSFTLLLSKGYMRTVESLRNRLMSSEWELGLRPIALHLGVSRFEEHCAENKIDIPFEALSELYDDPTDLRAIADPHLRMRARAIITQVESEERVKAWTACTLQAQQLASQFSEAEFLSKIIPDPIEHGVVDALRKMIVPLTKMGMGG